MKYVVKYFNIPEDIVSDRDTRFTISFGLHCSIYDGYEVKFLYNEPSSNRWPNRDDEPIVGGILEALCFGKPNELGLIVGCSSV